MSPTGSTPSAFWRCKRRKGRVGLYKVGDKVVYPHHGAGTVVKKQSREVLGTKRDYLTINILHNDMTVQAPSENADQAGLRRVIGETAAGGGLKALTAGSAEQLTACAKLAERPLLVEPLRRLDESGWVDAIVLVAPRGWEEPAILLAEELGCGKVSACVPGGEPRADSVRAGLAEVPADAVVVLVHDAARPLVPEAVIERVLAPLADGWDGVVPGVPVSDTLKRVGGDGTVLETVERDSLYAVQTPQAFPADVLRRAVGSGADATDCAGLVESVGGRVKVVPGDPLLLKVTTADDLAKIASWL